MDLVPSLSSPVMIDCVVGSSSPVSFANTSCTSLPRLAGLLVPPDDVGLFSSCGLCRDRLALVGEAKEGLREADFGPSFRGTGIRLGVVGASIGVDVVGDVLRRLAAESAIEDS